MFSCFIRTFNQYLRLCKRIAYECPIKHISDTFYRLLVHYVNETLATVEIAEDPISQFFSLSECPQVFELPKYVVPVTGEVIRETSTPDADLTAVLC